MRACALTRAFVYVMVSHPPSPLRGANIGFADVPPNCDGEVEQEAWYRA